MVEGRGERGEGRGERGEGLGDEGGLRAGEVESGGGREWGRGMRGAGGFWGSLWKRGGSGLRWLSGW